MSAFQFLASKRRMREMHRSLSIMSLANCGEGKTINEQLEKWEKECD